MKNLIDELHKLDEYEYKVSKDFSKNVMRSIRMNKKSNKLSYVISAASVGMVACLAVFAFHNTNIKNNFNMNNFESAGVKEFDNKDVNFDSNIHVSSINETEYAEKQDDVIKNSLYEDLAKSENATMESKSEYDNLLIKDYSGEKYNEIEKVLEDAEIEFEMFEAGFIVKATISEISKLLENYTNVVMEVQDEYVIIHVRE